MKAHSYHTNILAATIHGSGMQNGISWSASAWHGTNQVLTVNIKCWNISYEKVTVEFDSYEFMYGEILITLDIKSSL